MTLGLPEVLTFASILFGVGAAGLLARRSLLFMLASIEVMFVAGGVAFVGVSASLGQADGQVVFFFVLAAAAAQVSVALALMLRFHAQSRTIDADRASSLRG